MVKRPQHSSHRHLILNGTLPTKHLSCNVVTTCCDCGDRLLPAVPIPRPVDNLLPVRDCLNVITGCGTGVIRDTYCLPPTYCYSYEQRVTLVTHSLQLIRSCDDGRY